jgi:NAD(P)-dependent dehydrogenase (short-subunit alcohol dehydrogenase family)
MRILMTGASSGFGLSVANALRVRHKIVTVGIGDKDDHVIDFKDLGPDCEIFAKLWDDKKPFDAMILNAGIMELNTLPYFTMEQWHNSIHVNLSVPFYFMRTFVRAFGHITSQKDPRRIVVTGSMCYRTTGTRCHAYNASKAGLEALVRGMAREQAKSGFIFATVAPNSVENTPMTKQGLDHLAFARGMSPEKALEYTTPPIGRRIRHNELADIYEFAVERMPVAMTGTTFTVPAGSGV